VNSFLKIYEDIVYYVLYYVESTNSVRILNTSMITYGYKFIHVVGTA